jgi:hypothetical protein
MEPEQLGTLSNCQRHHASYSLKANGMGFFHTLPFEKGHKQSTAWVVRGWSDDCLATNNKELYHEASLSKRVFPAAAEGSIRFDSRIEFRRVFRSS